jgi:hypothetical protein
MCWENATSAENLYCEGQGSFPKGLVFTTEVLFPLWQMSGWVSQWSLLA